jgi:hypothetical protein
MVALLISNKQNHDPQDEGNGDAAPKRSQAFDNCLGMPSTQLGHAL